MAGPFGARNEVDKRARQLHSACGMTITSRWHRPGHEPDDSTLIREPMTDEQRIMYARMNVADIHAAHWFILNTDLGNSTRGGMHWEHGYASHRGLYCVVIGGVMSASLFAHLPENEAYPDWPAFMRFMQG